jgi:Mn-dependent DtxR family transcriptional regulator
LSLLSESGKARGRYEDMARLANVSLSTFKRVVKSLAARGLVEVVWRQKMRLEKARGDSGNSRMGRAWNVADSLLL